MSGNRCVNLRRVAEGTPSALPDRSTVAASGRRNQEGRRIFVAPPRHCEEHLRRSNPSNNQRRCEMDCFAALAMMLIGLRGPATETLPSHSTQDNIAIRSPPDDTI